MRLDGKEKRKEVVLRDIYLRGGKKENQWGTSTHQVSVPSKKRERKYVSTSTEVRGETKTLVLGKEYDPICLLEKNASL